MLMERMVQEGMVRDMDTYSKVNGENDTGRDGTRNGHE